MNNKVRLNEKLSYGLGMLGTNLSFGLVTAYILFFYTDVFIIPAGIIAILFVVARIWDAVNDPLMGVITDKTNSRWGRFRPWILISGILMPIFTTLMFYTPSLSETGRIVYAFATYILWGMSYTMSDIPKWSLSSVMTDSPKERVQIISIAKLFGMLGMLGINIAAIPLVKTLGDGSEYSQTGYFKLAIVISIIIFLSSLLVFFSTKERIENTKETSLKESFTSIKGNAPLFWLLLSVLINMTMMMLGNSILVHYTTYNLGDIDLVPIIGAVGLLPMLIGVVFTPKLSAKIGKKRLYRFSMLGIILRSVLLFAVGYSNLPLTIVFLVVGNLFFGIINVVSVAMLTDTIDYNEKETGSRSEGIIFSLQTFTIKMSGAIGGGAVAVLLGVIKYVPNQMQSEFTMNGLHIIVSILPAIGAAIAYLVASRYSLD